VRRVVVFFALSLSACTCGVSGVSDDIYACDASTQCNADQECTGGHCQPKGAATCMTGSCSAAVCESMPCGAHGLVCSMGACTCSGNGGVAEVKETSCTDGVDNDCDGATDCADTACKGTSCGTGCTCNGGPHETACDDGLDNDGDGATDCMDPDCTHRPCSATTPAALCCGIGSSAAQCKNLAADSSNCGGCGVACRGGACQAVSASGAPSGHCSCGGPDKCPGSESCSGSSCACSSATDCASGEQCTGGVCHY
jgi:hypothetical protein